MKIASSQEVWLQVGNLTWKRLSRSLKEEILIGLARLVEVRAEIALDAKVKTMPPVEVVGEIWGNYDGVIIDGQATVLQYQGLNVFGARLPVPTALCNKSLLRRILVHEFAHCFEMLMRVFAAEQSGKSQLINEFDLFDSAADEERLGNPRDWFGEQDASELLLHKDPELDELTEKANGLMPHLRLAMPAPSCAADSIGVPEDARMLGMEILGRASGT